MQGLSPRGEAAENPELGGKFGRKLRRKSGSSRRRAGNTLWRAGPLRYPGSLTYSWVPLHCVCTAERRILWRQISRRHSWSWTQTAGCTKCHEASSHAGARKKALSGQITSTVRAPTARRLAGTSQTRRATGVGRGSRCTSSCFCGRWTGSSTRSQRALAPAAPIPAATSLGSWRAERHLPASIGQANGLRVGLGSASPSSPSSRSLPPCCAPCCQSGAGARD